MFTDARPGLRVRVCGSACSSGGLAPRPLPRRAPRWAGPASCTGREERGARSEETRPRKAAGARGRGAAGSPAPRPLGWGGRGRDWTEATRRPRSQGASRNPGWVGPAQARGPLSPQPRGGIPELSANSLFGPRPQGPDKHRSRAGHWEVSPRPETRSRPPPGTGDLLPSPSGTRRGLCSTAAVPRPRHGVPRHAGLGLPPGLPGAEGRPSPRLQKRESSPRPAAPTPPPPPPPTGQQSPWAWPSTRPPWPSGACCHSALTSPTTDESRAERGLQGLPGLRPSPGREAHPALPAPPHPGCLCLAPGSAQLVPGSGAEPP